MTKKEMKDIITKIEDMHEEFDNRLDSIERVLILQEENLKTHMARSNHLETIVEKLKDQELKPIARHVAVVEGVFKVIGITISALGVLAGIIASFYSFFA